MVTKKGPRQEEIQKSREESEKGETEKVKERKKRGLRKGHRTNCVGKKEKVGESSCDNRNGGDKRSFMFIRNKNREERKKRGQIKKITN